MSSGSVIGGISAASAFLGLLCLIGNWLTALSFRRKAQSIRAVVAGDGVFDTERAVEILGHFRGEAAKLEALRVLVDLDVQRAARLLQKVQSRVDLTRFNSDELRARLQQLKTSSAALLAVGALGMIYAVTVPRAAFDAGNSSQIDNNSRPPIPIIINNNITPADTGSSQPKILPPAALPPLNSSAISDVHAGPGEHAGEPSVPAEKPAPQSAPHKRRAIAVSSSPRCESLLQRSSLGDTLSSEEQTELRTCT